MNPTKVLTCLKGGGGGEGVNGPLPWPPNWPPKSGLFSGGWGGGGAKSFGLVSGRDLPIFNDFVDPSPLPSPYKDPLYV